MTEDFPQREQQWQAYWKELGIDRAEESERHKQYILAQFPYPSGSGLHMGHMRVYTLADVLARFHRMQGQRVLHPMGSDAFGLPAENAAIRHGVDPEEWTRKNIAGFRQELESMGLSYDWSRNLTTCDPEYYGFTQRLFLLCEERGLAYRQRAVVNWCPTCKTVLANEQVQQGACWSCGATVVSRELVQWFLRITAYAEQLLQGLEELEWPEHVKAMQRNWIGRSEGAEVTFAVEGKTAPEALTVFTTRPDTLPGVVYLALAPQHPLVAEILPTLTAAEQAQVEVLVQQQAGDPSQTADPAGCATGWYAIHPLTKERIPIWIASYVLSTYGTGAVMGVPGHDERDFVFAQQHHLPVRFVVGPGGTQKPIASSPEQPQQPFTEPGYLCAGPLAGLSSAEAGKRLVEELEAQDRAKWVVRYRLRDWLISRQRYWGTPIPMVHCEHCGVVPVRKEDLPVLLPKDVHFATQANPLTTSPTYSQVDCPRCARPAQRELDTMDTFMDSSWYFLRFADPHNTQVPFEKAKAASWLPVDVYVGGVEHAVLHLLYARFLTRVLHDAGWSPVAEPFARLLPQGMVLQQGAKMSKSKGNVVSPKALIARYGADTARLFILFAAPPERDLEWSEEGVKGCYRFLQRVERLYVDLLTTPAPKTSAEESAKGLRQQMHRMIQRVTHDTGKRWHCNTAVSAIMEGVQALQRYGPQVDKQDRLEALQQLARVLAPFAPHVAETLWRDRLGRTGSVHQAKWPMADPGLAQAEEITWVVQINGKVRARVSLPAQATQEEVRELANPELAPWLAKHTVQKTIFVPGRLLNLVVKPSS